MKSKSILVLPIAAILILIYGFGGNAKWPGGSPGGYTGSPGDGKDCTQCHGGSASIEFGWITSDIPAGGYIPGETYTITVSVSGSGDKGFEVSPQDKNGDLMGTLSAGSGTHLVAGNTAVTQNSASSANPKEWQFEWVAPETGTGDVTFYGAFTVNKPVTKLSTYIAHENTGVVITESHELELSVYPNPAREQIVLDFFASGSGSALVSLNDMTGRTFKIIENAEVAMGSNRMVCYLPSSIQSGIYILRLQYNGNSFNHKLVIE